MEGKTRFLYSRFYFPVILFLAVVFNFLHFKGYKWGYISPEKSVVRLFSLIFSILVIFYILSQITTFLVKKKKGPRGETKMLVGFLRALTGFALILVIIESMGRMTVFSALGVGFIGMLLGWSLQAPVSGVAAWALITIRRPFRIGDRISFSSLGLVGDVVDIGLMYTILNQVGGSIGSEEAIGRDILIPNAMLFSQVVINYTTKQDQPYFLDEVVWRITFDSDWDEAEKIMIDAAKEVTADIIKKTGIEPYMRADVYDYGIYLRLRYITCATERPKIAYEINKIIFKKIQENPKVDLAIPYTYSYRTGEKEKNRIDNLNK